MPYVNVQKEFQSRVKMMNLCFSKHLEGFFIVSYCIFALFVSKEASVRVIFDCLCCASLDLVQFEI